MKLMTNKPKPEKMYAVWNSKIGFYVGTRLTSKAMIEEHTKDVRMTWEDCKKSGDKVIPVLIVPIEKVSAV